jgi:hypothetical protein
MCVVDRCRWDYMGESGRYYEDMDRTVAFQRGLTTWANCHKLLDSVVLLLSGLPFGKNLHTYPRNPPSVVVL